LCTITALNPNIDINNISPGQSLILPNPGLSCPTATPVDLTALQRGKEVEYVIQAGDSIAAIASQFNSTAEDILDKNNIDDANKIFVGQVIIVRVNLVTPTITPNPTITPGPTVTPGIPAALQSPTPTP
jgi:LysM repeat protein